MYQVDQNKNFEDGHLSSLNSQSGCLSKKTNA